MAKPLLITKNYTILDMKFRISVRKEKKSFTIISPRNLVIIQQFLKHAGPY